MGPSYAHAWLARGYKIHSDASQRQHRESVPEQEGFGEVSTIERDVLEIDCARVVEHEVFSNLGQLVWAGALGEDNAWVGCHGFLGWWGSVQWVGVVVVEEEEEEAD